MKSSHSLSATLMIGLSAFAMSANAEQMPAAPVTATPQAKALGADAFVTSGRIRALPAVNLGLPASASVLALDGQREQQARQGTPMQIGMTRDVQRSRIELSSLKWETLAGGSRGARVSLKSADALALRANLRLRAVARSGADPSKTTLRFAGNDGRVFAQSGADFAKATPAWSPVVGGDTMTVEIVLAPGQRAADLTLDVPQLSHLDVDPAEPKAVTKASVGASGSCERDIVCRVNPTPGFLAASKSVAHMIFTNSEGSFICTGTLLNNNNSPKRPLFWSAAHCIDSQQTADTLQTYWFFDATGCGNRKTDPRMVTLSGGAYLRHADTRRDTLLLELKQAPPAGAYYAAWNSAALTSTGIAIEGIHHPEGDLKKYSLGSVTRLSTSALGSSPLTEVKWTTGVTEGGSSGSALFTVAGNGDYQLRGGLLGGSSYCSNPKAPDVYSQLSGVWSKISSYFSP